MAYPTLCHPLILFLVGNLINTATAAYTQRESPLRYVAFIICLTISWLALSNFHAYVQTTGWPGRMLAAAIFSVPLQLFDRLLFRKWAFGHDYLGPVEVPDAERKKQSRWEFGSEVAGSIRCTGSSKEVANVPYFSQQDPEYVPAWSTFLLRHSCLIVGLHYLNTFFIDLQLRANHSLLDDNYIPFLWRITNVSGEELATRIQISITYWMAQYCLLHLLFSLFAVISVSLKPGELKFWRPMFGQLKSSYTIRGFWGKFWHQNLQLNLKGPADFISSTILHLPQGTIIARYAKVFFAFFVSGVLHVVSDSGGAVPGAHSGALRFFCTQALGIMFEDSVQELHRILFGNRMNQGCKAVGFLWVVAFLSWSTPTWAYPIVRTMKRKDMMLDPSALHPLISSFL